jgi:hypothetical protein
MGSAEAVLLRSVGCGDMPETKLPAGTEEDGD